MLRTAHNGFTQPSRVVTLHETFLMSLDELLAVIHEFIGAVLAKDVFVSNSPMSLIG